MTVTQRRATGAAGVLFVVATLIGVFAPGTPPVFDDPITKLTRYFVENDSQVVAGAFVQMLGLIFLLVFFTGLYRLLHAREDGWSLSTLFFAGAIAASAVSAVGTMLFAVPAWQSEQLGVPTEETVRLMYDTSNLLFTLAALLVALFIGAASVTILRNRSLPGWVGGLGILVTLSNVVGTLGIAQSDLLKALPFTSYLPQMLWVLVISVVFIAAPET